MMDVGHAAGCACRWCHWDHDHVAAQLLLAEARIVVGMQKAARDAHYQRVRRERGENAARDLVLVVNNARRALKTTEV